MHGQVRGEPVHPEPRVHDGGPPPRPHVLVRGGRVQRRKRRPQDRQRPRPRRPGPTPTVIHKRHAAKTACFIPVVLVKD